MSDLVRCVKCHKTWKADDENPPPCLNMDLFHAIDTQPPETVYLAGPMTGYAEFNYPAFDAAAAWLRGHGWTVHSPAEMSRAMGFDPVGKTGQEVDDHRVAALRADFLIICDPATTGIVLLPGWRRSVGAIAEHTIAAALQLKIWEIWPQTDDFLLVRVP